MSFQRIERLSQLYMYPSSISKRASTASRKLLSVRMRWHQHRCYFLWYARNSSMVCTSHSPLQEQSLHIVEYFAPFQPEQYRYKSFYMTPSLVHVLKTSVRSCGILRTACVAPAWSLSGSYGFAALLMVQIWLEPRPVHARVFCGLPHCQRQLCIKTMMAM